ncbi:MULTISPECIES: tetratricopeptide repeat protein [Arcicella]|uniref:Tetratricopeptide repeat protein n=1 Tax=Arcicella aquatica TaxID=217141 RepID=A0ABU5QJB8_9BACT|nr:MULTISPECIES: tetratricopeptide repeat protein [Arcicella]MDR6563930.1 putative Zn-dependent protease [Arcicella sp. BE51]MDR6813683.1 putative Zn-dependent protease [Arcicella sp. BE140]MDR6824936.1 putative Zn-dependent protease [Arcicella sp. BE139]MEA5257030.1 tetratricopeptide repeat protein [Arcicella aquatica]
MQKPFIIIIVIAFGLVGGLYSLPKVVVNDEKRKLEQTSEETPAPTANRDKMAASKTQESAESHGATLSVEQQRVIAQLKGSYLNGSTAKVKMKAADELIAKFVEYTRFDSAAYYAEEVANKIEPSETNLMKAGNLYYEAFTYSLQAEKTTVLGEKAREIFSKVLAKNPENLLAKTNMAMTYVSTSTPMQGITMLREVIAKEPDYEPALFSLGILSIRSNQFGKAVERFKQILKNNPSNSKAALNLGYCLAELDRKEEAKAILEKVLANSTDSQEKAAANEILSKLK